MKYSLFHFLKPKYGERPVFSLASLSRAQEKKVLTNHSDN